MALAERADDGGKMGLKGEPLQRWVGQAWLSDGYDKSRTKRYKNIFFLSRIGKKWEAKREWKVLLTGRCVHERKWHELARSLEALRAFTRRLPSIVAKKMRPISPRLLPHCLESWAELNGHPHTPTDANSSLLNRFQCGWFRHCHRSFPFYFLLLRLLKSRIYAHNKSSERWRDPFVFALWHHIVITHTLNSPSLSFSILEDSLWVCVCVCVFNDWDERKIPALKRVKNVLTLKKKTRV